MLKGKKAVYILIPLNVAIWSFFIYRFYSVYNDSDTQLEDNQNKELVKPNEVKDSIAYQLDFNYKDPFLKDVKNNSEDQMPLGNEKRTKITPVKPTPVTITKPLPDIKYMGLIKNNASGITAALITLNGQSHLVKINEALEGVVFKTFNKDSLVAKWGKERLVVRK